MSTIIDTNSEQEKKLIGNIIDKEKKKETLAPKYFLIIISTLLLVGKNYCFNIPQSLETKFLKGEFHLSNLQFDLFYSVYSFPNILLPFFGGIFVDKLGNRIGIILFSSLILLGQFLFLIGTSLMAYYILLIGRIIFGLGSETLLIVQHTIVVKWSSKNEMALAIALQAAIAKVGAIINSPLTPKLYDVSNEFFLPCFVGVLFCAGSLISGIIVCFIDKKYERLLQNNDIKKQRKIQIKDILKLDSRFWLLTLESLLIFGSYTAFTSNENHILTTLFKMSSETAGIYLMVIYIVSIVLPPFIGLMTDYYGKKPLISINLIICFIACLLLLAFLSRDINHLILLIPLVLHGIFLGSFFPIIWASIPLIVKQKALGTAYGVLTSFVNINQAISPIIFGSIEDRTNSNYFWGLIFITFQGVIALYIAIFVFILDNKKDRCLDKKPTKKNNELN